MKKKWKRIGIGALACVALLVCILPFPVRIRQRMYMTSAKQQAGQLTVDERYEKVPVEIRGWYLNFLFLKDRIKFDLDVNVSGKDTPFTGPEYTKVSTVPSGTIGKLLNATDNLWKTKSSLAFFCTGLPKGLDSCAFLSSDQKTLMLYLMDSSQDLPDYYCDA